MIKATKTRRKVTKAKTKSNHQKGLRKVQKGSERIQKVTNRMEVAVPSSVGDTLNATQGINKPPIVKIKGISDEIQTIARDYEESGREGDFRVDIEIATLLRWKQTIDAFFDASESIATANPITQILKNTEEIKKRLETPPKQTIPTWSQIAASAAPPAQILSATERRPLEQTEQKRKELKITIKDEKEREELKKKDMRTLVTAIKAQEPRETTAQVNAVRRLPSGEILIPTLTEKARRELEKCND